MKKKRVKSFAELNKIVKNDIFDKFIHSDRNERRRILKGYGIKLEGTYKGFYREKNNAVVIPGKKNPFTEENISAKVLNNNIKVSDDNKVLIILSMVTKDDGIKPEDIFTCRIIKAITFSDTIVERNYRKHSGLPVYTKSEAKEEKKKELETSERVRKEEQKRKTEDKYFRDNHPSNIEHNNNCKKKRPPLGKPVPRQKNKELIHNQKDSNKEKNNGKPITVQSKVIPTGYGSLSYYERREIREKQAILEERYARMAMYEEALREQEATDLRPQKIKGIVEERKIRSVVHFTRLENLASILENGLIPVSELKKYAMNFVNNDKNRYDYRKGCICTSLEYPNSWVMQRFMDNCKDSKWVIIVIDSCVLYENNCFFAEYNAATKEIQKKINSMNSPEALNNLFKPVVEVNLSDGNKRVFDRRQWPMKIDCFPTSDQAEVLVEGRIVKEKIKTVFFMDRKDASKFRKKCNANNINVNVDEELFVKSRQQYFGC